MQLAILIALISCRYCQNDSLNVFSCNFVSSIDVGVCYHKLLLGLQPSFLKQTCASYKIHEKQAEFVRDFYYIPGINPHIYSRCTVQHTPMLPCNLYFSSLTALLQKTNSCADTSASSLTCLVLHTFQSCSQKSAEHLPRILILCNTTF